MTTTLSKLPADVVAFRVGVDALGSAHRGDAISISDLRDCRFRHTFHAAPGSALRRSLYTALASSKAEDSHVHFVLYTLDASQKKKLGAVTAAAT